MQRLWLQRLAMFARRRYGAVFVGALLVSALSVWLSSRLSFDTDMLNLLPRKDPAVHAYLEALETFGANTYLLVAVRLPEDVTVVEPYEALADELAARLGELPQIKSVQHRIGDPEELLATFFPKAVLFLDDSGRAQLTRRLSDEGIRDRVSELRRQIATPQGLAAKELAKLDPLGLSEIFLGRIQSSRGTLQVDWTSGYYLSRDRRMLLLLAEPVEPPQDIPFAEGLEKATDEVIAGVLADWEEIAGPGAPKKPEVVAGGPYLTSTGDASLIRYDIALNSLTSTVGVVLLFLFAYRRLVVLAYAFIPLVCGLLMTFAFSEVTIGSLNSATSVVAGLLIGLGVDFAIVSYGRYTEERRRGATLEEALLVMSGTTGRAVFVGALTTTATFYAFAITDFRGLSQMGILTGTGIIFCVLAILVLLPAMLAWSEDHHAKRDKVPNHYLHSFGSVELSRLCLRHRRLTLLIGLLVTLVSVAAMFQLSFDESMKTMRPKGNRGIEVAEEVGKRFGSGFDSMILLVSGDTPEEVIELSAKASEGARKLIRQGILYGYNGPTSLIPSPSSQAETLGWLERERADALNLERIRATFAAAVAAEGMRVQAFEPGLELFAQAIQLQRPIGVADFQGSEQTRLLLDRFLRKTDDGWKAAVYLYPPSNRWRREAPPEAVRLAQNLGPKVELAGTNLINQRVRSQVIDDAWVASILGVIIVALMIWADFRSLRWTLYSLIPLVIGLLWMFGAMVLFGIPMNFINIFVTTMIIGIGVDYGVHVLHRYREAVVLPDAEFETSLMETGKAVVAASLSTIVGFGSLIFSHYPGLQSTGKVAILGALSTCLVSITLLPVALSVMREQSLRRAAAKQRA